mgnify:CR=1 FL=1
MDTVGGWMSEIRGFYGLQSTTPVSASAQALWNYLMYRANAAWWAMPLIIRNAELEGALGLRPWAFKEARRELVEAKFLLVEAQGGSRPSKYFLLSCLRPGAVMAPSMSFKGLGKKEGQEGQG